MYSLEANLLYRQLKSDSKITNESIIQYLIDADLASVERKRKLDGENYYDTENDIKKLADYENQDVTHKIPNGFYKKIVNQKVSYCLGNDITFEGIPDSIEFDVNDFIDEIAKDASKKGLSWLYPYIDENNKFNYKIVSSLECIPIYDTEFEDKLLEMIRYYRIEVIEDNVKQYRYKVEVYDNEKVTYYMQQQDLSYVIDYSININPVYYNSSNRMQVGNVVEMKQFGWKSVPFIPFLNDEKGISDLNNIKALIDLYDKVYSDFANNIEAHQDSILVIVDRGAQDLPTLKKMIKEEKIICVDDVSKIEGIKYLVLEIPIEARKEVLKMTRNNIFGQSMSVDTENLFAAGGNIPQSFIDGLFYDLELKGADFIKMIKKFLKALYTFYNEYAELTRKEKVNFDTYKATFIPKKLKNESEQIKNNADSVGGVVSDRTRLTYDPRVVDVDQELKEIEIERNQRMIDFENNMNDDEEGSEENE